jgi:predicted transposase YdaD
VELKAVNHRLDGVLWPQRGLAGTARQPVVKLELQMQRDTCFKHRLGAQTLRFLQLHPKVRHLQVVVVPHRRLNLGPARLPRQLQLLMDEVLWICLEELGQQDQLDPLLNLLRLPVRRMAELQENSQRILQHRPDLAPDVVSILMQRLPTFSLEQIMVYVNIPTHALRHSRAAQELIEEGLLEGRQEGEAQGRRAEAASMTLRLLNHRCGPLTDATSARIQALPLERLEALGLALLDFSGAEDLAAWLEAHAG